MNLFEQNMSKKDQLYEEFKRREFMSTHEVIEWGIANFSNRALRDAQQLASDGRIRRLTEKEKAFRGYTGKEGVWTIIKINA